MRHFSTLLALLLVALPFGAAGAQGERDPSLLAAAYIYNFAKYTQWPDERERPIVFCIFAGDGGRLHAFEQLRGEKVRARSVSVRAGSEIDIEGCDLIYLDASYRDRLTRLLERLQDRPVLTVGEIPGFARAGGIVELYTEAQRLRFTINLPRAREAGLQISSRLLELAGTVVRDGVR